MGAKKEEGVIVVRSELNDLVVYSANCTHVIIFICNYTPQNSGRERTQK